RSWNGRCAVAASCGGNRARDRGDRFGTGVRGDALAGTRLVLRFLQLLQQRGSNEVLDFADLIEQEEPAGDSLGRVAATESSALGKHEAGVTVDRVAGKSKRILENQITSARY